jgi:hypothetical protein
VLWKGGEIKRCGNDVKLQRNGGGIICYDKEVVCSVTMLHRVE